MDAIVLRRVLNGLRANTYNQLVTVIVQLVGVPILLYAWSIQLYGEWLILFALPAYLSMTDLGFSQPAGNDMTARFARGDRAGALRVYQSVVALVYGVAALGLILSLTLVWHLPLHDWLQFQAMDADATRLVLLLLVAEVFVRLLNGVTHAGFRAVGEYALHVSLDSCTRLLQFAGVWVAALVGGGPVSAAAFFFFIQVLATPAQALLLTHRHPWLRFGLAHARRTELRRLFRPALASFAFPLGNALNIQGMVLVIGATLGPIAVVVFSTLRTLTRLALQLVFVVSHAAEPEISAAFGAGNRPLMQSLFIHALRAGLWLALAAVVGLGIFGGIILDVWTHGSVAMNSALFAWLLASAAGAALWSSAVTVLKACNLHLGVAVVFVLAAAATVGITGVLLEWTGNLANAGLALLLTDVLMTLYALSVATRFLGINPFTSLAQAANPYILLKLAVRKARMHRRMH